MIRSTTYFCPKEGMPIVVHPISKDIRGLVAFSLAKLARLNHGEWECKRVFDMIMKQRIEL